MFRSKRGTVLIIIITLIIGIAAYFIMAVKGKSSLDATTTAVLNSYGSELLYTKPDFSSPNVKVDDDEVHIEKGTIVTVLHDEGDWCKISYMDEFFNQKVTGYISKRYLIAKGATEGVLHAKAISTSVVYNDPTSGGAVEYNGEDVVLSEGDSFDIIGNFMIFGTKWYKVKVSKKADSVVGFIPAGTALAEYHISMDGSIYSTEGVTVSKEPGDSPITYKKNIIKLPAYNDIFITGQVLSEGEIYDRVEFDYENLKVQGYIKDNYVIAQNFEKGTQSAFLNLDEGNSYTDSYVDVAPKLKPDKTAEPVKKNIKLKPISDKEFDKLLTAEGFPEDYKHKLYALHKLYPYWKFKAYDTGLDWEQAVAAESRVGLNLVHVSLPNDYKSKAPGAYDEESGSYIAYDSSTYVTASEKAVRYFMDPRNFLDEVNIFMFEDLTYQRAVHNIKGIETALNGTPMHQTSFNYKDGSETKSKTYSRTFLEAARISGVSPYFLAARVKQEVVISPSAFSSSVTNSAGYYNYYNIGAANSTVPGGAIAGAISFARSGTDYMRPWNNPYRGVVGGAMFIGQNYINIGQNTMYFQKFNVTNVATYNHQYVANITTNVGEAQKAVEAYGSGVKSMNITFRIPVYHSMPSTVSVKPRGGSNVGSTIRISDLSSNAASDGNNSLKSVKVSYSGQYEIIRPSETEKTIEVQAAEGTRYIRIAARAANKNASVSGTGRKRVSEGTNIFNLTVTAQNGQTKGYRIVVRVPKSRGKKDTTDTASTPAPANDDSNKTEVTPEPKESDPSSGSSVG